MQRLEVSAAVRHICMSLGFKRLKVNSEVHYRTRNSLQLVPHISSLHPRMLCRRSTLIPSTIRWEVGVSDAVRGTAGYRQSYWITIGRHEGPFQCCKQTENIKHFEQRIVSQYTVRMFSGSAVATRHSPRTVANVTLWHSQQGSSPVLWTVHVQEVFHVVSVFHIYRIILRRHIYCPQVK